jgi:hypothetical protein
MKVAKTIEGTIELQGKVEEVFGDKLKATEG